MPDYDVINEDRGKRKYHMHNGDAVFRGVYSFLVKPIPRRNCFDEEAMQFLQEGVRMIEQSYCRKQFKCYSLIKEIEIMLKKTTKTMILDKTN